MLDLDSVVAFLGKPKSVSITGFCWGGNVTWMYAAHNPKLKAGIAWYGRVVGTGKTPVDIAPKLTVPVLGLYGGKDKGIPLETVEKMRAALKTGKSGSQIHVYEDAEHGFHADYRPAFHAEAAADGWKRTLKWLEKHGAS